LKKHFLDAFIERDFYNLISFYNLSLKSQGINIVSVTIFLQHVPYLWW